jgi:hypothetical protein
MFNETGCVPGIDVEQVPAERIVPDAILPTGRQDMAEVVGTPLAEEGAPLGEILADLSAQYILEAFMAGAKMAARCDRLAHRRSNRPEQYLTKEQ